ncbi:MAG: hypothetical protein IPN92_08930 [Chromatiaceae bacterium]|nr:hypothetical protein [Chromatiaceae bacterium]
MTARNGLWRRSCFAAMILVFAGAPAGAEVAGSVDAGLQDLAAQIVQKSTAADRTKIAILPFPNADKTCSVLSTYIVDELTLALFSVPASKLTIVERAQLESLINELTIGEGGLLNPETTKELGKISGVQALAVGTITVIGDTLRINSRLVATDTGETISAAAVNVPKTNAIHELLGQRTPCGTLIGGTSNGVGTGSSSGTTMPGRKGGTPPMPMPVLSGSQFTTGDLTFSVQSASRSEDKKAVNISFMVINGGSEPLDAMFLGPQALLSDSQGNSALATHVTGMGVCVIEGHGDGWQTDLPRCWDRAGGNMTTLMPQGQNLVLMRFSVQEDKKPRDEGGGETKPVVLSGDSVSFSSRLGVKKGEKGKPQGYSIGIANIPLK